MKLFCQRCGKEWEYDGPKDHLDECPRCENEEEVVESFTEPAIRPKTAENKEVQAKVGRLGWRTVLNGVFAIVFIGMIVAYILNHDTWAGIFLILAGILAVVHIGIWTFKNNKPGLVKQIAPKRTVVITAVENHRSLVERIKNKEKIV